LSESTTQPSKRNVGRPLAASEAQQADVLRRRDRGESPQHDARVGLPAGQWDAPDGAFKSDPTPCT